MKIGKEKLILLFMVLNVCLYGQCPRYEQAYMFISKDFEKQKIPDYFKSVSMSEAYGIMVYEKILPVGKVDYKNWIDIEKTDLKGLSTDCCLHKLKKKNWRKNWKNLKYYKNSNVFVKDRFKGPTHIAFFSSIKNDSLRVDVISNSSSGIQYCGSVHQYLFVFNRKDSIKSYKDWTSHYECGGFK